MTAIAKIKQDKITEMCAQDLQARREQFYGTVE